MPFLPKEVIRKQMMGLIGIWTQKERYRHKLEGYPNEFNFPVNYDGATELFAKYMKINPIVWRLLTFDEEAYNFVQKYYGWPKGALKAIIISIAAMPDLIHLGYAGQHIKREMIIFKERLKRLQGLLKEREAKVKAKTPKKEEEETKKEEEDKESEKEKNSEKDSEDGSGSGSDGEEKKKKEKEKKRRWDSYYGEYVSEDASEDDEDEDKDEDDNNDDYGGYNYDDYGDYGDTSSVKDKKSEKAEEEN